MCNGQTHFLFTNDLRNFDRFRFRTAFNESRFTQKHRNKTDRKNENSFFGVLGFGGFFLALTVSLFFAWTERKVLRVLALLPLLLCLGSCVVTTAIERSARQARFEGDFRRYAALVEKIQGDSTLTPGNVVSVPVSGSDRDLIFGLLAERSTNGALSVEMLTGGGFPVKHSGYLYTSSGSVQPGSFFDLRWPFKTEVKPKWFRISD
jgi:hypothetical protein